MPAEAPDIEQPEQLAAYLRATGRIGARETPACRVLQGGVSNKTVLVERADGSAWVVKQALEKLRVQADWFSSPLRIHREALGIRWFERLAPPGAITPLIFEDEQWHILAMQAVPQPHENWKTLLLAGDARDEHIAAFGTLLGTVQARARERRAELEPLFGDRSFFESLRLEPYYGFAAERVPQAAAFLNALKDETRAQAWTLVHGDYSPKNVLIHAGRLVLLDHEVAHWGDGAFDLGFALTHLLSKAHHLPQLRERFAGAAELFWRSYQAAPGADAFAAGIESRAARHTLACLLARVDGRSPLEYLGAAERERQRAAVLTLLARPPATLPDLIRTFTKGL